MKEQFYYFSHDSNARNDEKILALRMKHDWKGYGIYWALIEILRESNDYSGVCDYNLIAYNLRTDAALVKSIINEFGLFSFTEDGKRFYSESLKKRMELRDNKVNKLRQNAQSRWSSEKNKQEKKATEDTKLDAIGKQLESNSNANAMQLQCNSDAIVMQEKKRKEKERKEKERKEGDIYLLKKNSDDMVEKATLQTLAEEIDLTPPKFENNIPKPKPSIEFKFSDSEISELFADYPNLQDDRNDILAEQKAVYDAKEQKFTEKTALIKYLKHKLRIKEADKVKTKKTSYFLEFWDIYGVPLRKNDALKVFLGFTDGEIEKVLRHSREYVAANPDVKFRKNPTDYLKSKMWLEPVIYRNVFKNNGISKNGTNKNGTSDESETAADKYQRKLAILHESGY